MRALRNWPRKAMRHAWFDAKVAISLAVLLLVAGQGHAPAQATSATTTSVLSEARRLHSAQDDDAAARLLNSYLSSHAEDADALTLLAQIRIDQGDSSTAQGLLTRALNSSPNSPAANLTMGELLLKEHRDPEAMDRFETVLAIDLRNTEARHGEVEAVTELAVSAREKAHPDAALKALEHARGKLGDDPKLLLELGIQANELGLLPEADDALQAARKLSPQQPDVLYALARLDTDRQHMAAAEADFRAYLVLRPEDASAHYGLGNVLAVEQRHEEARTEFERSIQLQPLQTESYYQLGEIELQLQHDAQAEPLFRKVLGRDPAHAGALTGIGILLFRRKEYAQAEESLARAEKTAPQYQPAHYFRGLALTRLGRKDEAEKELRAAAELDRRQRAPPGAVSSRTDSYR